MTSTPADASPYAAERPARPQPTKMHSTCSMSPPPAVDGWGRRWALRAAAPPPPVRTSGDRPPSARSASRAAAWHPTPSDRRRSVDEWVGGRAPVVAGDDALHHVEAAFGADLVADHAAQHHLERRLLGVAEGAVVLHAVEGRLVAQRRAQALHRGDHAVDVLAAERARVQLLVADHPGAALQVELEHVEHHPVIHELEADGLVLDERLAERLALGGVVRADLDGPLGGAQARREGHRDRRGLR